MAEYTWSAENLIKYPLISAVAISPSGDRVAYTVRVAHMTDDASEFRHELWLADVAGEDEPRILAFGESAEQPRWSPDGTRIAFLRKHGPDKRMGLFVISATGGEAWAVTEAKPSHTDVAAFRWSPDGERIAFLAPPLDADKQKRLAARDDTVHWRVDDDRAQIYVAPVTGPQENPVVPDQRTFAQRHVTALAWSPDGDTIAFTHQSTSNPNSWRDLLLATVPANGDASVREFGPVANREDAPSWSPDGKSIACLAGPEPNVWPYAGGVAVFSVADGTRRDLAPVSDEEPILLGWDADGTGVYVVNQTGISTEIDYVPADGSTAVAVCAPEKLITAVDVNAQGAAALVLENFDQRQTVYTGDFSGSAVPELTRVCAPISDYPSGPLPQVKLVSWQTADKLDIDGILYLPEGYDQTSDGAIPLLLHVHGGPSSVFQRQFSATPYYYTPAALCERGIAVLRCNPRGSGGYGKEFRFANKRDWGGKDYGDLQQGVDTVIETGIADPDRLGVAGWSYGGFMTSWTITQTDRFKAASIGAAVTNLATFCATADITDFIPDYFGGEAWEIPEIYRERSPITYVAQANTPSIVQHGGADQRVPLEQGLQYFNALQRRGVPVDMYIYPRQGHAINEPRLLADAIRRNLEWFTKMLVDTESA